jgi:hypothetical protein
MGFAQCLRDVPADVCGLRLDNDSEEAGLDALDHGEAGYHHEEAVGMVPLHMMAAAHGGRKSSDDVRTQGGLA